MLEKTFAENLKKARNAAGLTQDGLSKKSDCRQNDISEYECEKKLPNLLNAVNIADALGVSLDALCGKDEKSKTITAFQWLRYLDALLDNPPSIDECPIIQLRQSESGTTEIVFSSAVMQDFFKKYIATRSIKETIGDDLYYAAIEKLFDGSKFYFTPGSREKHIYHHPPDLSNFSGLGRAD